MARRKSARNATQRLFRLAIAVKGVDGAAQLLGGLMLLLVSGSAVTGLVNAIVTRDLLGDPNGVLARHLQTAAENFTGGGTRTFAVAYLLAHGLVKLGLVLALAREIGPAYPVAVVVLAAFVVYEVVRAIHTHSIALVLFAALDVLIIVLVVREYGRLRRERPAAGAPERRCAR
jgi:uncharacterized membrane protein